MKEQKGILYKIYIRLRNTFDPPRPLSEEERICYDICKRLMIIPNSSLTTAPLSNRRYIKNDEHHIFIIIGERTIKILNQFYFTIYCEGDKEYLDLIHTFDQEMETRRIKFEDDMQKNVQHSLTKIHNDLG